jgi:hypothetical protein
LGKQTSACSPHSMTSLPITTLLYDLFLAVRSDLFLQDLKCTIDFEYLVLPASIILRYTS